MFFSHSLYITLGSIPKPMLSNNAIIYEESTSAQFFTTQGTKGCGKPKLAFKRPHSNHIGYFGGMYVLAPLSELRI